MTAVTPAENPAAASPSAADEQENPEECGWCRWMKAGGCKAEFEVWQKCVDDVREAGREDVETCSSVMGPLWECMQKHADYYSPQVDALREGAAQEGETSSSEQSDKQPSADSKPDVKEASSGDSDTLTEEDVVRWLEELDKEGDSAEKTKH